MKIDTNKGRFDVFCGELINTSFKNLPYTEEEKLACIRFLLEGICCIIELTENLSLSIDVFSICVRRKIKPCQPLMVRVKLGKAARKNQSYFLYRQTNSHRFVIRNAEYERI